MMQVALFGNPNTGKTSLFNQLTGSYEYIGNWSGVTVEKKVGDLRNSSGKIIDLPGVYTLNPLSKDESVATRFLLNESFTSILNIVDASQLYRNLHLTVQLLEFGKPIVIGLNMVDMARRTGIACDEAILAARLKVPIIPIVARTGAGCHDLAEKLQDDNTNFQPLHIYYGKEMEVELSNLIAKMPKVQGINKRWLALQLLEGNEVVLQWLENYIDRNWLQQQQKQTEEIIKRQFGTSVPAYIHKIRQRFIEKITAGAVKQDPNIRTDSFTDRLDQIVTHRWLGIPIFLFVMFSIFKLTFDWLGTPISNQLSVFFAGPLSTVLNSVLEFIGANSFIQAVVLQGIVAGVGGVLVFVPQIFIMFFFISFIEDSGYMARVALVMDRLLEKMGLNGKAFIPMIIGFGCNVPGIMAARTIEQPKERLLTVILTPLMSCSARLTVYSLFVGAFFEKNQAFIVLFLYTLGVLVALILAKVFSLLFLKHEHSVFVIELPPYRVPHAQTLMRSTWDKGKGFVRKAGTFILGGTILIWLLSYTGPSGIHVRIDHSFMAMIGRGLTPLLAPIGFGTWQAGAALITGFLAKEVVVSTMNILYFVPDTASLQHLLSSYFSPLSAFSFMVFTLLYIPCLSTVAIIQKELGSKKWTIFSIGYALIIAYILTWIIYHSGQWLGFR